MPIDYSRLALPKPEPRKRIKARTRRRERTITVSVRALVVLRDGACAIDTRVPRSVSRLLGGCDGPSEWAHIGEQRRCHTRGQAPERRHTTAGTAILCRRHHQDYDAHQFEFIVGTDGMNGTIGIKRMVLVA